MHYAASRQECQPYKIVSKMLGYASIAITLDTYSPVLPNMQNEAAKAMEDALS